MTIGDLSSVIPLIAFVACAVAFVYVLRGLAKNVASKLLLALSAYLAIGAIGTAILITSRPYLSDTPAAALGAMTAFLGWIGLGLHLLFRLIPTMGERPKPRWMMRFGIFDVVCLLAICRRHRCDDRSALVPRQGASGVTPCS
jgi:hypothetical protein